MQYLHQIESSPLPLNTIVSSQNSHRYLFVHLGPPFIHSELGCVGPQGPCIMLLVMMLYKLGSTLRSGISAQMMLSMNSTSLILSLSKINRMCACSNPHI